MEGCLRGRSGVHVVLCVDYRAGPERVPLQHHRMEAVSVSGLPQKPGTVRTHNNSVKVGITLSMSTDDLGQDVKYC